MIFLGVEVPLLYSAFGLLALYIASQLVKDWPLRGIPAVGYTFPILNWITAIRYVIDARSLLDEGYEKYPNGVFRVAMQDGWQIVATSPQLADEVRRAPDDVLNLVEWSAHILQVKYTLGEDFMDDPYHFSLIRTLLTKNSGARLADMRDEIATSFEEEVGASEEWKEVAAVETMQRIVSRVTNRAMVGLPLCRDREWVQLNIDHTVDVAKGAMLIKALPGPLRRIASWFLMTMKAQRKLAHELAGPHLEERLRDFEENGEKWDSRPDDMMTWLVEACPPRIRTAPLITNRILLVNFAAIHTSSSTFLHVLYRLAANPEFAEPMREEAERVVAEDGWSKTALNNMRRIDSFIRETQRLDGLQLNSMNRWVMKPFTFSNGVQVPAGHALAVTADAIQRDPAHHDLDAAEFNPWRFSDVREEGAEGLSHRMVTTKLTLLAFGHGRHACPGRFFAEAELKGMLAHIVLEYDVRFKEGMQSPGSLVFAGNAVPREGMVEFKRRAGKTEA